MLPIYDVIDFRGNRYLLAKAVMKRARQINFMGDEELEQSNNKIVSLALKQTLKKEINYYLPKKEKYKEKQ